MSDTAMPLSRRVIQCPCERSAAYHGDDHAIAAGWRCVGGAWRCPDHVPTAPARATLPAPGPRRPSSAVWPGAS